MTVQYTPAKLIEKITQNNYSYTNSYTKKIAETNTAIEKLQDKAGTFREKVRQLKRYSSGGISRELLATQAEELVKAYNDMTKISGNVTDKDIQKQLTKLEKLFSDNEKNLKKAGIEKVNGKYTFDSDTFEEASDKYIDALFVGHDSFIGQADRIMRKVEETEDNALYNVTEHKLSRTLKYDETDMLLAANVTLAGNAASAIKSFSGAVQSGSIQTIQESVTKLLKSFAKSVYRTDLTAENEDIDKLNQLCLENKEKLARIGLYFDPDEKNMIFNDSTDMTTDDFKDAYNELFGPNASFGNDVSNQCKIIFNSVIQPEKLGVSVLDQYT